MSLIINLIMLILIVIFIGLAIVSIFLTKKTLDEREKIIKPEKVIENNDNTFAKIIINKQNIKNFTVKMPRVSFGEYKLTFDITLEEKEFKELIAKINQY